MRPIKLNGTNLLPAEGPWVRLLRALRLTRRPYTHPAFPGWRATSTKDGGFKWRRA